SKIIGVVQLQQPGFWAPHQAKWPGSYCLCSAARKNASKCLLSQIEDRHECFASAHSTAFKCGISCHYRSLGLTGVGLGCSSVARSICSETATAETASK